MERCGRHLDSLDPSRGNGYFAPPRMTSPSLLISVGRDVRLFGSPSGRVQSVRRCAVLRRDRCRKVSRSIVAPASSQYPAWSGMGCAAGLRPGTERRRGIDDRGGGRVPGPGHRPATARRDGHRLSGRALPRQAGLGAAAPDTCSPAAQAARPHPRGAALPACRLVACGTPTSELWRLGQAPIARYAPLVGYHAERVATLVLLLSILQGIFCKSNQWPQFSIAGDYPGRAPQGRAPRRVVESC